ncbi:MAG: hypothetical protein IPI83_14610 [Sphingomonadales bacterium]|nr:hypothetical protein [Sphingomonadales bacterium]
MTSGINEGNAPGLGIRLRKLGLVWPIDPEGMAAFAAGRRELLVIEEKRPVIEDQAAGVLLGLSNEQRPVLTGKRDPQGKTLLSSVGELSPSSVRRAIYARLNALGLATKSITERFEYFESASRRPEALPAATRIRPAFFCSGCLTTPAHDCQMEVWPSALWAVMALPPSSPSGGR